MKNRNKEGVEARFVANKIVKKYFEEFNENDLTLTCNRLNRLVELVDLVYRKNNQWKPLCGDGFVVSSNGLVIPKILYLNITLYLQLVLIHLIALSIAVFLLPGFLDRSVK